MEAGSFYALTILTVAHHVKGFDNSELCSHPWKQKKSTKTTSLWGKYYIIYKRRRKKMKNWDPIFMKTARESKTRQEPCTWYSGYLTHRRLHSAYIDQITVEHLGDGC